MTDIQSTNTTACYVRNGGKTLMICRAKMDAMHGKWIPPGGKFEPGETPEECVIREVAEETGLTLIEVQLRGILTFVRYMDNWDYDLPWYHGAQQELTTLRVSSSITQDRDIARIFSHCPGIISMEDDGSIKHNGRAPGYRHIVDEPITADDVEPHTHPINASKWEWLTKREIRVRLIEQPALRAGELLTEGDIAALRERQRRVGQETFCA